MNIELERQCTFSSFSMEESAGVVATAAPPVQRRWRRRLLAANRNSIHPSFYVYSMYIGAELSRNRRENILYTKVLRALLLTGSIHK